MLFMPQKKWITFAQIPFAPAEIVFFFLFFFFFFFFFSLFFFFLDTFSHQKCEAITNETQKFIFQKKKKREEKGGQSKNLSTQKHLKKTETKRNKKQEQKQFTSSWSWCSSGQCKAWP
jgi:cell division protein FtsI/penicillin-binding protein 2